MSDLHTCRWSRASDRCGEDITECVTVLLGTPEPSPHRTLGLSECLDNLALGLSSLGDPKHAANLLPGD